MASFTDCPCSSFHSVTADYLAPEIIKGKGHDWGADYWALGVLLYELTHGFPPFYDENPSNTGKKVMKGSYSIPPNFSRPLVDLVSQLLTNQSQRLGRTQGGTRKIRKHPWFDEFDWQALLDRGVKVPYVPKIENLEKIGTKDDGKWDAPETNWNPHLDDGRSKQSWQLRGSVATVMATQELQTRGSRTPVRSIKE